MSNRPDWDDQFRETPDERNERLRNARSKRQTDTLLRLIADLSECLTDEGPDVTDEWLSSMRRRVANALPDSIGADWLRQYRDPPLVQS